MFLLRTVTRVARLGPVAAVLLTGVVALAPARTVSAASTQTQTVTIDATNTLSGLTTGGPFTFLETSPTFNQFNPANGTLVSATLSWDIDGTVSGAGDYAGTAVFSYAGASKTQAFDTRDTAPRTFELVGSVASPGTVTGTGTFAPSTFKGTIGHSGYFPWGATMSASGTVTLVYTYNAPGDDVTAPVFSNVPNDITAEATASTGASVTYTAPTATDAVDGARTPTCTPASGSTFKIGVTTVTCSVVDTANNASTVTFSVNVVDTTKPVVVVPTSPVTAEATSATGADVSFTATASDAVSGSLTPTCIPASGSAFTIGATTVTCSATDTARNTGTNSFTVNVSDTTPPVYGAASNLTAEATEPTGASVSYTQPTATDLVGVTSHGCTPASGAKFPISTTTVNCTARDAAGNTGTTSFTVTVRDTTAPAYGTATNVTVDATAPAGARVTYTTPTATDLVGVTSNVCTPGSATTFAIGTTTVTCTAADAAANTTTTTLTVTVKSAAQQITSLQAQIAALKLSPTLGNSLQSKVGTIQTALAAGDTVKACTTLRDLINQIKAQSTKAIPRAQADSLVATATRIRAVIGCP